MAQIHPQILVRSHFFEKYAVMAIVENKESEANYDIQDYLQDIPARQREDIYQGQGILRDFPSQRVIVEMPILTNSDIETISNLQTRTFSTGISDRHFDWQINRISKTIETKGYGFEFDPDKIAGEVNRALQDIRQTIGYKNEDINEGNRDLLEYIKTQISTRKQSINKNKDKLAALTTKINVPLKRKVKQGTQAVRLSHTTLVRSIKPKPTLPEEYVIDEERVNDVITLLDNQARNYEQTPKAIKELDEENLRDLLLANLNSVFEGGATGETFSKNGKTDIYLKINKGNILICECKFWGGKSLYATTIDQLRGYLTWRHNYGIMITFVRIKEFTKTLSESESAIRAHHSYLNGFKKIADTHFASNHKVDDEAKEVKLHHLFYHLYF
jgi:hypothetical protein